MKYSKTLFIAIFLICGVSAFANDSDAITKENVADKSEKEVKARVELLLNRVDQIRSMDPTEMEGFEKQSIREELKEIKKELKVAHNGTLTISVGAAIIIVLLLIILF
ncbi:MAG: hypothetical protein RJQ14_15195 [Marinoscillum sp.]